MRNHPWLFLRNSTWYLRAIVPTDLRDSIGRTEIWKSLKTKDRSEANLRVHVEAAKLVAEFEKLRIESPSSKKSIDVSYLEHIARQWVRGFETKRAARLPPAILAKRRFGIDYEREETRSLLATYTQALKDGEYAIVRTEVQDILKEHELKILENSDEWQTLAHFILRGIRRDLTLELMELGDDVSIQKDVLFDSISGSTNRSQSRLSLSALIEKYSSENGQRWSVKTALYYKVGFDLLRRHFGEDRDISSISRDDVRKFRDLVRRLPPNHSKFLTSKDRSLADVGEANTATNGEVISEKTAGRYISTASSLFEFALEEELINSNPAKNVASKGASVEAATGKVRKKRRPFNLEELKTIFECEEYANLSTTSALRWVPLIALFHGFRMNEILQLEITDVLYYENILTLHITPELTGDDEEGNKKINANTKSPLNKSVKTDSTKRYVPVHPKLIALGFEDIWKHAKSQNWQRVFQEIPAAATGYYSDIFTKHFTRYITRIGVKKDKDRSVTFHGFRHNFRDACRHARITTEFAFALGGWSETSVGNAYGQGHLMSDLLEELQKIDFPEIRFSRVTP